MPEKRYWRCDVCGEDRQTDEQPPASSIGNISTYVDPPGVRFSDATITVLYCEGHDKQEIVEAVSEKVKSEYNRIVNETRD